MPTSTSRPARERRVRRRPVVTAIALLTIAAACSDASHPGGLEVAVVGGLPADGAAGQPLPIELVVTDASGAARGGVSLEVAALNGGGSVAPASVVTDAAGHASLTWTLGVAPVQNQLGVFAQRRVSLFEIHATVAAPYEPQPFGDVNAFLTGLGIAGSTEDLAFSLDGERLVLGVPGGLIALDPQGNAFDAGTMYISLLAVPPFTPATARGASRLAVGIPGLPLLQ